MASRRADLAPRSRIALLGAVITVAVGMLPVLTVGALVPLTPLQAPLPASSSPVPQSDLNSVVCTNWSHCVAVGRYESSAGSRALILTKSATVWGSPKTINLPSNAFGVGNGNLLGVACTSVGECVAVGQYQATTGYQALIVTEHAGVWGNGIMSPLPFGPHSTTVTRLTAISCPAFNHCEAVGQFKNAGGDQGFMVKQVGGVWTSPQVAPLPPHAKSNFITQLDGISCTSVGNCVAVGQYVNTSPARQSMIVTEKAGVWVTSQRALLPLNAHRDPWSGLFSIKCTSYGYCVAVGVFQGPAHGQGLIIGESGGHWGRGIPAPLPVGSVAGVKSDQLLGVSCLSTGFCYAVGQFTNSQVDQGVVITESHGGWGNAKIVPHPANGIFPLYEGLNAIAFPALNHFVMVGQYQASLGEPSLIVTTS